MEASLPMSVTTEILRGAGSAAGSPSAMATGGSGESGNEPEMRGEGGAGRSPEATAGLGAAGGAGTPAGAAGGATGGTGSDTMPVLVIRPDGASTTATGSPAAVMRAGGAASMSGRGTKG